MLPFQCQPSLEPGKKQPAPPFVSLTGAERASIPPATLMMHGSGPHIFLHVQDRSLGLVLLELPLGVMFGSQQSADFPPFFRRLGGLWVVRSTVFGLKHFASSYLVMGQKPNRTPIDHPNPH